jgi:hypothetical protein
MHFDRIEGFVKSKAKNEIGGRAQGVGSGVVPWYLMIESVLYVPPNSLLMQNFWTRFEVL